MTAYGAGGGAVRLDAAMFDAALRLRRALTGAPRFFARAIEKLLGLSPARLEIRFWDGRSMLLSAPPDQWNFLCDIHGIILRDQYDVGDLTGKIVADAGANIGVFSLYAFSLGAEKVYAFEPVRETFELLKANLALSRTGKAVEAVHIALGERAGSAEIRFNTRGEGSAMMADAGEEVNRGVTYAGLRRVRVAPLDSLIKGRVDFLKIDVEGYEENVLLGAAGLIRSCKPALSMSAYHRRADRETLTRAVLRIRGDYGVTLNTFAEHDLRCR